MVWRLEGVVGLWCLRAVSWRSGLGSDGEGKGSGGWIGAWSWDADSTAWGVGSVGDGSGRGGGLGAGRGVAHRTALPAPPPPPRHSPRDCSSSGQGLGALGGRKGPFSGKGPPAPAYRIMKRTPVLWSPWDPSGDGKVWVEGKTSCLSLQPGADGSWVLQLSRTPSGP